jgi:hypothetical protein
MKLTDSRVPKSSSNQSTIACPRLSMSPAKPSHSVSRSVLRWVRTSATGSAWSEVLL